LLVASIAHKHLESIAAGSDHALVTAVVSMPEQGPLNPSLAADSLSSALNSDSLVAQQQQPALSAQTNYSKE
jgi:hypothetical protein